jgi:PleD family two-component response regulator
LNKKRDIRSTVSKLDQTTGNHKKKILIFSTDFDFCKSLEMLFQSKYDVFSTTDMDSLFSIIANDQVDLLLTDSAKSERDILRVIKNIKSVVRELFVVLLYVYKFTEEETENEFRKYVNTILYKPIDVSQLENILDTLLVTV